MCSDSQLFNNFYCPSLTPPYHFKPTNQHPANTFRTHFQTPLIFIIQFYRICDLERLFQHNYLNIRGWVPAGKIQISCPPKLFGGQDILEIKYDRL